MQILRIQSVYNSNVNRCANSKNTQNMSNTKNINFQKKPLPELLEKFPYKFAEGSFGEKLLKKLKICNDKIGTNGKTDEVLIMQNKPYKIIIDKTQSKQNTIQVFHEDKNKKRVTDMELYLDKKNDKLNHAFLKYGNEFIRIQTSNRNTLMLVMNGHDYKKSGSYWHTFFGNSMLNTDGIINNVEKTEGADYADLARILLAMV